MKKLIKSLTFGLTVVALVTSGAISSPANAVSPLVVTVSKTTSLALAGEAVSVSVTGIPDGQGIYVYQCASILLSPRQGAATCRSGMADSLWLTTNGGQGSGIASQQNQLTLLRTFSIGSTKFDCAVDACSVFVRRDHMGGSTDFTLDTIVPISFAKPTPTPKATQTLPTIASSVKVGKYISFRKTTNANLLMVVTTSTPNICSVAISGTNFKVTGKKAGTCKLTLSQKGSAVANPLRATVKSIRVTS
jgi:hypothetical protein